MATAFLVNVNDQGDSWVESVEWQDKSGLSEYYATIGCELVEVAGTGKFAGVPVIMWVDEEGLYREPLRFNRAACDLIAEATDSAPAYLFGGGLVGRALLLVDEGSTSRGFTAAEAAKISAQLDHGGYSRRAMSESAQQ